ncbi:Mitochondrial inner membrane peptidase complex subunit [Knufia obscura]|uniref:Mitochondrial inner membrane protease subunit n=2 Tax=Knufia TaxID=430999 RepID=A0AAN8ESK2_9EURO|nr:Mitochondrial inner membrane peptidase complex subunit [Knufia obscura]KAK5951268.1 Mitochondrial inner membrane peptidase complex subunit [Knufia fluminis]
MSLPTRLATKTLPPPRPRLSQRIGTQIHDSRRYIASFAALLSTFYLLNTYIYDWSDSSGPSMYPTIPDKANLLFVNKTYRLGRGIKVGDCVQISNPMFPRQYSGKRVVGMPGDYVLRSKYPSATPGGVPLGGITDWRGRVEAERVGEEVGVNKQDQNQAGEDEEWDEPQMIQVPEGHVWLEGDNLSWSRDSRFFGPVPMALLKGRSSGFKEGLLSWTSLNPGRGLRKVEDWEVDAVLGQKETSKRR